MAAEVAEEVDVDRMETTVAVNTQNRTGSSQTVVGHADYYC